MAGPDTISLELEPHEVALVIGEEDEGMSVRIVAGSDVPDDSAEMPAAPEIVLALAMRLLKDPEFHDEVLDWYYDQQDDDEDEDDEANPGTVS